MNSLSCALGVFAVIIHSFFSCDDEYGLLLVI